jgi:hypothetical protein
MHPLPHRLSLAAQLMQLRAHYPTGQGAITRSTLYWEQAITPHALSGTYQCHLEYQLCCYPHMYCVDPPLSVLAAGRRLPHVYQRAEPVQLCLFMHNRQCWNDNFLLAKIVLPLTYYWLAHFEHWLFTGDWLGGGTHPVPSCPPSGLPRLDARNEPQDTLIP